LLEELRTQLAERGPGPNHTEVVRIEARLLAVEDLLEAQLASVEFSGLIREEMGAHARPFRELWMMARLQGSRPQLARGARAGAVLTRRVDSSPTPGA
jgi:predicted lipid-binding transport protein (Tim44 family)